MERCSPKLYIEIKMCAHTHTKAYEIRNYMQLRIHGYMHTYASIDNCFTRVSSLTVIVANNRDWLEIIVIEKTQW